MREVFDGFDVELTDAAPGALPGLTAAPAAATSSAVDRRAAVAKLGWTDVARFAGARHPGAELRPGRPQPRARPRRARRARRRSRGRRGRCCARWPDRRDRCRGTVHDVTAPSSASAHRGRGRPCAAAGDRRHAPPTSACSTRAARPTGSTRTPGGRCASCPSSWRASTRSPSCRRRSACSARRARKPGSPECALAERLGAALAGPATR